MRTLPLTALVALGLALQVSAEEPPPPPGGRPEVLRAQARSGPTVATATSTEPWEMSEEPFWFPDATSDVHEFPRNYGSLDFIYWRLRSPGFRGVLLNIDASDNVLDNSLTTEGFKTDPQMGFRAFIGHRFSDEVGVEIGGFLVNPSNTHGGAVTGVFNVSNSTLTTIGTYVPQQQLVLNAAMVYTYATSGIESNARVLLYDCECMSIDGLVGLRWFSHWERFKSLMQFRNNVIVDEQFKTTNDYIGPQLGIESRIAVCRFITFSSHVKALFGANLTDVSISGPAGIGRLTGPGNIGVLEESDFGMVVDLGFKTIFHLTPNLHFHAGYDAMWMNQLYRVLDQLDFDGMYAGNPQAIPNRTEAWLAGFSMGLELTY